MISSLSPQHLSLLPSRFSAWQLLCLSFLLPIFLLPACSSAQALRTSASLSPVPPPVEKAQEPLALTKPVDDTLSNPATDPTPSIDSEKPAPHIALILPLSVNAFAAVAESVKLGFLAGVNAEGSSAPRYRIYSVENEGDALASAYKKALSAGAKAVVAGITRDGATRLAKIAGLIPALAINAPTQTELPNNFYFESLSIDTEARLVAQMALADGLRRATLLVSNDALSKRIEDSFGKEWKRLGGEVVAQIAYNGDPAAANRIRDAMEKINCDMVFMAANPVTARLARPYLPVALPIYATSQINDARADPVANVDLDDVRLLEMPWFVEADHPAVMVYAKPAAAISIEQERLYALGVDAWRLIQLILKAEKKVPPLDGVTGRLTLAGHEFVRGLTAVQFRDGRAELLQPASANEP